MIAKPRSGRTAISRDFMERNETAMAREIRKRRTRVNPPVGMAA